MQFDTWLSEADVKRIYKVCTGELSDAYTSEDELSEFSRVIEHAAMIKLGGEGYDSAVLQ